MQGVLCLGDLPLVPLSEMEVHRHAGMAYHMDTFSMPNSFCIRMLG